MNQPTAYVLVATGFILILNLMAFISLRVNYNSTRKPYLLLGSIAIGIEALRQIPALLLSFSPESFLALLLSFFLQFFASWMLLCAIIRKESAFSTNHKILLGLLFASYVLGLVFTVVTGYPHSTLSWLAITLPAIFTVLAVLWKIRHTEIAALSGKILLFLSGISLASIRIALLIVDSTEMVYLLYYLDVLVFPILVSALVLAEIENAHSKLNTLLKEKTRSEANLRFILDNSVDIILTVNSAGLLLTWNKRAENVFGYTNSQAIRKMYIDDLFSGNYWHKNTDKEQELSAIMERIDGKTFSVKARIKTIIDESETQTIYVIRNAEIKSEQPDLN
ncbi:MAG: PAS domain S-box protein [Gammaproteobacteria bacterium]|nr:PAS domain S-box protein [Gammaproteobacteria bacterium]